MGIKDFLRPPLSQEWVDMVRDDVDQRSEEIEQKKGPEAANAYRERRGRTVARLQRRVDPRLDALSDEGAED